MQIECQSCDDGTASDNTSCSVCGGDGFIDLLDEIFGRQQILPAVHGLVWAEILTQLENLTTKVDDVMNKCDDIKEVVDEL